MPGTREGSSEISAAIDLRKQKDRHEGGLSVGFNRPAQKSGDGGSPVTTPIGEKTHAEEAEDHHRPGGRLGNGGDRRREGGVISKECVRPGRGAVGEDVGVHQIAEMRVNTGALAEAQA